MTTDPAPRRPFYRRKRWLAAGLLWLILAYVAAAGPVEYLSQAGLMPRVAGDMVGVACAPLGAACRACPPLDRAVGRYLEWWMFLAI